MTFDPKQARQRAEAFLSPSSLADRHNDPAEGVEEIARDLLAALDALEKAEAVRWEPGMCRLHVATGTTWWVELTTEYSRAGLGDASFCFVVDGQDCLVSGKDDGQWAWAMVPANVSDHRSHLIQHGTAPTESEAMQAALDAAGWRKS